MKIFIKYKFVNDKKYYLCHMTLEQYNNFQELAIVEYCNMIQHKPLFIKVFEKK